MKEIYHELSTEWKKYIKKIMPTEVHATWLISLVDDVRSKDWVSSCSRNF